MGFTVIYDFVAVDFETATKRFDSACAIGIVAVHNGEITDTFYSLIKPPNLIFDEKNIKVHGITPDLVKESPTLDYLWRSRIHQFFGPHLVVAHKANFDISVLKQSLNHYKAPNFKYVDSISIVRDYVPGKKSLEHCAEYLGINMGQHHNALDDAMTCAKIVLRCFEQSHLPNIGALCFAKENIKVHSYFDISDAETYSFTKRSSKIKNSKVPHSSIRIKDITPKNTDIKNTNPLFQKIIVFTGEMSIGRRSAMQLAVDVGAIIKSDISKKAHYLVVGERDPEFTNEAGLSRKEVIANQLNETGKAHIQVIGEKEFFEMVGQEEFV